MLQLLQTRLGQFRLVALCEGVSFLLFMLTVPLKYGYDIPEPNMVVGMTHGILFMLYVVLLVWVGFSQDWSWKKMILGFIASFLPFGTFVADKYLFKEQ